MGKVKTRLEELVRQKCIELGGEIKSLSVGDDHVHLFVQTTPTISPNSFVGQVKGFTSRVMRQEFGELRSRLPSLWTRSYFVSTHGHISDRMIQSYIEEQKGM